MNINLKKCTIAGLSLLMASSLGIATDVGIAEAAPKAKLVGQWDNCYGGGTVTSVDRVGHASVSVAGRDLTPGLKTVNWSAKFNSNKLDDGNYQLVIVDLFYDENGDVWSCDKDPVTEVMSVTKGRIRRSGSVTRMIDPANEATKTSIYLVQRTPSGIHAFYVWATKPETLGRNNRTS